MRVLKTMFIFAALILPAAGIISCLSSGMNEKDYRIIKDSEGRQVQVPDTLESVIAIRSGALRLICYMNMAGRVGYIEGNEKRRTVPYLMANPELTDKDAIGTGNYYDTELLAASDADIIIATYMTSPEADELQRTTGKPVFIIDYGDMKDNLGGLFSSLDLLGELFYRKERADSLEQYIRNSIAEFKTRTMGADVHSAYIGGVAYRGAHGISSTEPGYPPFRFLPVFNVALTQGDIISSPLADQENAFIDIEQLIIWNPAYIFLDAAGEAIWKDDINRNNILGETVEAFQTGNLFTVLPYNWYTTNYENVLCNAWFIGKTVYPGLFEDIDPESKCREIYNFFLGEDVYDRMSELYGPFVRVILKGEA